MSDLRQSMAKRPRNTSQRAPASSGISLYSVEVDHLSNGQLCSLIELIEQIYSSRVEITPRAGTGHWLKIEKMTMSEAGLRVATRLFGVPFEHCANQI